MGNNPFLFAPTDSYSQPSPSSSSSQSPLPSPSPSSNSCSSRPSSDSSPSLNSPLQPSRQSLPQLPSHTSSSHFDPPSAAVVEPCAACKILRRRCTDKCFLASYFPSTTEQYKFNIIDSVFGVRNAVKFLQGLPECQRGDAVSSMVYEANARIRDPVYGCVGQISLLQKQVDELQAQLAKAQAEVVNLQCQQANLLALMYMETTESNNRQEPISQQPSRNHASVVHYWLKYMNLPLNRST